MKPYRARHRRWTGGAALIAASLALTACSAGSLGTTGGDGDGDGGVTLRFLVDNSEQTTLPAEALAADFTAANPGITVQVETRPQGSEGDNVVKTRLATGDMAEVFQYNSGSLFQALSPQQQLAPVTGEGWVAAVDDEFRDAVTADGEVYGAPFGTATGGGVLYNREVYQRLGLQVPTTWDQFMANNAAIRAAGIDPVIQTYQDTWTSQLFVLGDFHNVATAQPTFAEDYTANRAKFATSAAVEGFEHLQQVHDAGYQNADFAATKLEDGLRKLTAGEGAHYPMLTFAVTPMVSAAPASAESVGFFALPGPDAATNGVTAWLSSGVYIPAGTEGAELDAARRFLAFVASPAGCESQTRAAPPAGPYLVRDCALPADVPQAVQDLQGYFDRDALTPALEFLSPVKGPALEQITVEVGSGIRPAADGAALYDEDVRKQAQQLGLAGW
jgi:raffinose/stachyose/melibiose transport system substrate-binding protein